VVDHARIYLSPRLIVIHNVVAVLVLTADERVGVQVKLGNPLRTRAIPEHFCSGDSLRRGAISSVCTFTFYLYKQWLKWSCEAGGAHLTKPGWSKSHTHSTPN